MYVHYNTQENEKVDYLNDKEIERMRIEIGMEEKIHVDVWMHGYMVFQTSIYE